MIRTGLDFAPGTTDACKHAVQGLYKPDQIFAAYNEAKIAHRSTDLVLVATESGLHGGTRADYAAHLHQIFGRRASEFGIANKSAHSVVKLPPDSDAVWFVIIVDGMDLPLMCVIYAVRYEMAAGEN